VVRTALLDLLDLQDSLVIQDPKDRRAGLEDLVEQGLLVELASLEGRELRARKVQKDRRVILDSRDQRGILDWSVHLEHRDSLEMLVHRDLLETLDSQAVPVGLEVQAST